MGEVRWNNAPRYCIVCGERFVPMAPTHVYCSSRCRTKAQIKREKMGKTYQESPNMMRIREMVKDDPNYAKAQLKEMGK